MGFALIEVLRPELPRIGKTGVNPPALGFTLLLTILTALIFGLTPAFGPERENVYETLKEGGRSDTGGARRQRMRRLPVMSEVALATLLLIGAGLALKTFANLLRVDPGFQAERAVLMDLSLPYDKGRQESCMRG
ncbi:MAG: hypothetical protein J2P21_01720 [Chloracidobacterium sp.]|nr:hypothetical protein [Chloracidobacterium sp.]